MKNNYYNEIKNKLIDNEVYKKVKDYSKNRNDLSTYYEVGKLLIKAQGGEERAKYGDNLIKEYSERLFNDTGRKYNITALKRIRQFYLVVEKGVPLAHQLTWSHYCELLPLKDINEINYYIKTTIEQCLSKRQLRERIRNKEYQRLDDKTKLKLINKEEIDIKDNIKNSITLTINITTFPTKLRKIGGKTTSAYYHFLCQLFYNSIFNLSIIFIKFNNLFLLINYWFHLDRL